MITNGGIAGRITKMGETYIGIEIAENVEISVQKERHHRPAAQGHDQDFVRHKG